MFRMHWPKGRYVLGIFLVLLAIAAGSGWRWYQSKYAVQPEMRLNLREFTNAEYPEDPAPRSSAYGKYHDRTLTLVRKDDTHFDFVLEPTNEHTARIVFRDIDVSLMTPSVPEWTKPDPNLLRIALVDRQWNRQQVAFVPGSPQVELSGGDGFEKERLVSAELAKNCLNAGLWEVLLFIKENDNKTLYYQGWFTFPLGIYSELFERNTGLVYRDHWYQLEHWLDPEGTPVPLTGLREVISEQTAETVYDPDEPMLLAGEQVRKNKILQCRNVRCWKELIADPNVKFSAFIPPGRYSVDHPKSHEFHRIEKFEKTVWRKVRSPAQTAPLEEIELVFRGANDEPHRFFVGGFDLAKLKSLPVSKYTDGLYMPMGIGVPPFMQSYADLQKSPPALSPYFSVLLDAADKWVNHHDVGVDGPVLHLDADDPTFVHVYLLSYERETLVGHFKIKIPAATSPAVASIGG